MQKFWSLESRSSSRITSFEQDCQIDSFGAKKHKFVSFEKHLAPNFLFGYLDTFWLFCNYFVPQIFLGEELRVTHLACSCHYKTRSGPPDTNEHPGIPKERWRRCASGPRNLSRAVPSESVPAVQCIFLLSMFEPGTKSIEHKHTLSPQRILIITDTECFVMALVWGHMITDTFLAQLFANW